MAVVAGVVFFAVRALLALIPALTVSFPIKKWSAAAALIAAAFYLLLSGAEVATQRSYIMIAIMLWATFLWVGAMCGSELYNDLRAIPAHDSGRNIT